MSSSDLRLCLYGAGGHGRVVAAQIRRQKDRDLCFADGTLAVGSLVGDLCVAWSAMADIRDAEVIVTIGSNATRAALQIEAEVLGLPLARFVAEPERYYGADLGPGSMILAGAVVTADARIGRGVIVNTGAIVEHDADIGDFCHLAPGSVVAGGVKMGPQVFLGANATVIPGISIVGGTIIGAGAVVRRDISRPGTYVGVPARPIEHRG